MKKMSVEWHQECLSNSLRHELEMRRELENLQKRIDYSFEENNFKKSQIALAKLRGIIEFDGDKFGRKKR